MTKKQKRRSEIIQELTRQSRNSWANALPCDYLPLEAELAGKPINYTVAIDYIATMGQQSWPGCWQGNVKAKSHDDAIESAIHQLRVEHVERLTIKGTSAEPNGWNR